MSLLIGRLWATLDVRSGASSFAVHDAAQRHLVSRPGLPLHLAWASSQAERFGYYAGTRTAPAYLHGPALDVLALSIPLQFMSCADRREHAWIAGARVDQYSDSRQSSRQAVAMASSSLGRSRSSHLASNTTLYSGTAALLALLVVLRRQLVDKRSTSNSDKGSTSDAAKRGRGSKSVSHTPLTTPQVEAAQRELYRVLPDGSRELLVPTGNSGRIAKVIIRPVKESTYAEHRKDFISDKDDFKKHASSSSQASTSASSSSAVSAGISGAIKPATANAAGQSANQVAKKVAVNREFLRQLRAILKIIIPRWVTLHQPAGIALSVRQEVDYRTSC